jgi:hypothetical protein
LLITYVLPLLSLAILAWIGIQYRPVIGSITFLIVCASFWYSWATLMGLPRPYLQQEIDVQAFVLDEPNYIYVWSTDLPPTAYRIPWDMDQAKLLNSKVEVRYLRHQGEWILHPKPQEDFPPKE